MSLIWCCIFCYLLGKYHFITIKHSQISVLTLRLRIQSHIVKPPGKLFPDQHTYNVLATSFFFKLILWNKSRNNFISICPPIVPQRPPQLIEPDGHRYIVTHRKVDYLDMWTFHYRLEYNFHCNILSFLVNKHAPLLLTQKATL